MPTAEDIKQKALADTAREFTTRREARLAREQAARATNPKALDIRPVANKKHRVEVPRAQVEKYAVDLEERVHILEANLQKWQMLVAMMAVHFGGEVVIDGMALGEMPTSLSVTGDPATGKTTIKASREAPNVETTEPLSVGEVVPAEAT